jgi:hypothetical protein
VDASVAPPLQRQMWNLLCKEVTSTTPSRSVTQRINVVLVGRTRSESSVRYSSWVNGKSIQQGSFRLPSRDAWVSANTTVSHKWLGNAINLRTQRDYYSVDFSVFPVFLCLCFTAVHIFRFGAVWILVLMPFLQKMRKWMHNGDVSASSHV